MLHKSGAESHYDLRSATSWLKTLNRWTDTTWNPVTGCTKISAGCDNCYAERFSERFRGVKGHPFRTGFDLTLRPDRVAQPLKWKRPRMVFVNSMSDLFHKSIPPAYIASVFDTMEAADWHVYQILTKRSSLMQKFINERYGTRKVPAHIWLGVSVEHAQATSRIVHLQRSNATVRFLFRGAASCTGRRTRFAGHPLGYCWRRKRLGARPMQPEWALDVRDQCVEAGVAFFFKQWGGRSPKATGRLLGGREWNEFSPLAYCVGGASIAGLIMTDIHFSPDEIGPWSEIKLEIIEKYGPAYTQAFSGRGKTLRKFYIDGFSGAGLHRSKATGANIEGSPARALKIVPPFDGFYFIDMNKDKTEYLRKQCEGRAGVTILTGDCSKHLTREVLPKIRYELYTRALCLLDPYGMHLNWDVIQQAGQSRAVDMFLNFPVMDMNRNAIWRNPGKVRPTEIDRMNWFWGDDSWLKVAYVESRQQSLFGDPPDLIKQDNETIAAAFRDRLQKVAGFAYVPEPLPMRNSNNAVLYYLFFAAASKTADKIIREIFEKYR